MAKFAPIQLQQIGLNPHDFKYSGERNGEWFDVTLHIALPEQAVAVKKWVDYVAEAG